MTLPIDLLTGGQNAVVKLLQDQLGDRRVMVRTSLKQDAQPPFHLVGDIDTEDVGGKDEQAEQITVDVHTVYKGGDRAELLAMMHEVRLAVHDQAVTIGHAFYRFRWLNAVASTAAKDGVTYAGITIIEILAEPA